MGQHRMVTVTQWHRDRHKETLSPEAQGCATLSMAVGSKDSLTILYIDSDPGTQSERVTLSLTGV